MGLLDGKVAIVTGGGRGLGRSHALLLAQNGAKVVVNVLGGETDGTGKSSTPAEQVVKEIKDARGEAVANYDSVVDFDGAKRIIDCAVDSFGKLNILVNNAGILRDKMTFNMSEEEWDGVIAVHLKGTFNCGRWACAYFREQAKAGTWDGGRIINTTSHSGLVGNPGQANYGAAKAGIAAMTVIWAMEMGKYNVTCNAVAPIARTRMTGGLGALPTAEEGQFDDSAPENVSPIVAYLASDAAASITGKVFCMRGGKFELFQPWQVAKSIDIGKRWTVKEIGERISEFGDLSKLPSLADFLG